MPYTNCYGNVNNNVFVCLIAIADNCSNLTSIFAFGLDEISRPAVHYLLRALPRLRRADFGGYTHPFFYCHYCTIINNNNNILITCTGV
jgi:hypothetical protein